MTAFLCCQRMKEIIFDEWANVMEKTQMAKIRESDSAETSLFFTFSYAKTTS